MSYDGTFIGITIVDRNQKEYVVLDMDKCFADYDEENVPYVYNGSLMCNGQKIESIDSLKECITNIISDCGFATNDFPHNLKNLTDIEKIIITTGCSLKGYNDEILELIYQKAQKENFANKSSDFKKKDKLIFSWYEFITGLYKERFDYFSFSQSLKDLISNALSSGNIDDMIPTCTCEGDIQILKLEDLNSKSETNFVSGKKVKSQSFGIGTIISSTALGDDFMLEVEFSSGKKRLVANYAKLEILE